MAAGHFCSIDELLAIAGGNCLKRFRLANEPPCGIAPDWTDKEPANEQRTMAIIRTAFTVNVRLPSWNILT